MPARRSAVPVPRSAVVTGGAGGIGAAIATELVGLGYAVVVTDVDGAAAARTAGEIGAVAGVALDVRDEAGHTAAAAVAAAHAPLGVWVNNAGVGFDGATQDMDAAQIRALLDVNLLGVIWGVRSATAALRAQPRTLPKSERGGDIVNIASLSALGPVPGLAVYAATKAAVLSLTTSLHTELRGHGIRVHAVNPDGVATRLLADMTSGGQGSALIHSGGRLLQPADVARAAVAMIGTHRVYRTLPGWRGAMMRTSALSPSVSMRLEPLLRWQGNRAAWRQRAGS